MEAQKKKQRLEDINQPKEQKQILSHYSSLPTQVVNPHSTILVCFLSISFLSFFFVISFYYFFS